MENWEWVSSVRESDFRAWHTWFKPTVCHVSAVGLWASCLTSRILGLVPYKVRVTLSFTQGY